jgi:hypothetical protein
MLRTIVTVTVLTVGAGVALAQVVDHDRAITGPDYGRATAAAIAHVGGQGQVVETEVDNLGTSPEVELRLPDGTQVEVELDRNFRVLRQEVDDDGPRDIDNRDDDD